MAGAGQKASRGRAGAAEAAGRGAGGAEAGAGSGLRAPGLPNQALQSLLAPGGGAGPAPRIHQGHVADGVLAGLGARGAAVGRNILLARGLGASERASVLRHELRHVAQTGGRDVDPGRPIRLGPQGDAWECAAAGGGDPGAGADPQVIRRDDPPMSSLDDAGGCDADAASATSYPEADTDAGTCELEPATFETSGPAPLTEAEEIELATDPAHQVCAEPYALASFDPEAVEVAGMRNDTLNSEAIRVDAWVDGHSFMSPRDVDLSAYERLQQRLKAERAVRVQLGHLWMATAVDPAPEELLMLNASSGETVIIRVDQSIATGVPNQSFPGPVMTRQQFDDHMAGLGIPILTEEEYLERLRQTAAEIAPQLLMTPDVAARCTLEDPFGTGAGAMGDPFGLGGMGGFGGMGGYGAVDDPLGLGIFAPSAPPGSFGPGSFGSGPHDPGGIDIGPFRAFSDDDRFRGYYGGSGRLDHRVQSLSDTMPWRQSAFAARAGELGEGYAMRHLGGSGAVAYDNGRWLWNARSGSNRLWQGGGGGGDAPYRLPSGIDPFLPVRRGRDSTAAVDIRTRSPVSIGGDAPGYDLFSVKTSFGTAANPTSAEANRLTRHSLYFDELAALGDTGRNNLRLFRDAHFPGADLAEVGARMALMIPEDHAREMREVLRNPTGFETTKTGRQAGLPNWAQANPTGPRNIDTANMRPFFANATFPANTPGLPAGVRTGADLHRHFAGNLADPEFARLMNHLGEALAGRVHGFDLPENVVRWHQSYREGLPGNRAVNLRAGGIEFADWMAAEQRLSGGADVYTPDAGRRARALNEISLRSARNAGGVGTGASLVSQLVLDPSRYDDPELYRRAALEGVAGAGATALETRFNARMGREIVEEGLETSVRRGGTRVFASRLAGRAIPGLADAAIEIYDLTQDGRENSTAEIITRTGRAAVIGGGSAWAGAAVGTAVGGPVGFVVGLGVGFLVGWAANELLPGGREDWDREHEAEQRRLAQEAEERRRAEYERRLEAARTRIRRLNTPLSSRAASSVGVEGLFSLPVQNPDLMTSAPFLDPTVGELEHEYILTILRMAEAGGG